MAATPEQLRQRIGAVSLKRFLATPATEQAFMIVRWRAAAEADRESVSLNTRWGVRDRLRRLDEWAAAAGLPVPESLAAPAGAVA